MIPYPTDYRSRLPSREFRWDLGTGAEQVSLLLHEWVGLWVYRLTQKHWTSRNPQSQALLGILGVLA